MGVVVPRRELAAVLAQERAAGRTVVFTNGVFDLLHAGHARYLQAAKALGDVLVVAINTDASCRRLKGGDRPFVPEGDRAELLAALASVDYVTFFDEDTPVETLALLQPAIHVKGGDYRPDDLPETPTVRAYGGTVQVLPFHSGRSTTTLASRIRRSQP